MSEAAASEIAVPALPLRHCTVAEHCQALGEIKELSFWWYLGRSRLFGNFSIPFQGRHGNWWYQVKPGLCWPVDCFKPIEPAIAAPPFGRSFHGYQHVVADAAQANSHMVINAITDLGPYGPQSIDAKRRNAVRKGLRSCTLTVLEEYDRETFDQCRYAWDELTLRTGWKRAADKAVFDETWRLMIGCPGISIIVGRDGESGQVAGFLITKIIGDTAYVDTIASRTSLLRTNVNDAVMYAFLMNARQLPGVSQAHYAIRSYVESLEKFKHGLGFSPMSFPAYVRLRLPTKLLLKLVFPDQYRRMLGLFEQVPADAGPVRARLTVSESELGEGCGMDPLKPVRETIGLLIRQLLADHGRETPALADGTGLFADGLGLDSLDFATLIVRLEQETGFDPFRTGVAAGLPRTLGELIAIYERTAAG